MTDAGRTPAWRSLIDSASAPYRGSGTFAWRFARGKLRWDPVFGHLLANGLIAPQSRVLDIGCGQGLLASVLRAADAAALGGRWPTEWSAAPTGARVLGIELLPREVARARGALGSAADFVCGDMRSTTFPAADTVVILDALHYVSLADQDDVLARARKALAGGGRLVIRVGNAASRKRFGYSEWIDRIVNVARGRTALPRSGRTLPEWLARLRSLGFDVASVPMQRGTLFANVLLVGTVTDAGAACAG